MPRTKKSDSIKSERRVKLHVFEPSKRQIWTVVGLGEEHWISPEFNFCSCRGYYFGKLKGKKLCYHLELVSDAKKENEVEIVNFSDDEYNDFTKGLIDTL
ncbi:MAG TPA: hypothetical protein VFM64_00510 [Candidatus Nitrosotenuis sp.]|nr:hypothetical protein [Candidatus Nitrosotenuis sp.]